MPSLPNSIGQKILFALVAFLTASAVYLYGFPQPNVWYAGVVLLHAVSGILATLFAVAMFRRVVREGNWVSAGGWLLFLTGAAIGLWLIHTGTLRSEWNWMYAHMAVSVAALGFLIAGRRTWSGAGNGAALARLGSS